MESNILQNAYAYLPADRVREKSMTFPIVLLAFYLLIEYGRPLFLAPIKPGLLVQGFLILCLLPYKTRINQVFREKYFKLYLVLLLFMIPHVFIATNNFYALMGLKVMVSYLIVGVSFCVFIDSINKLKVLFSFFIFVITLCAVNRIFNTNFLGISGGGVFGDENDFALIMNVALPIAFFLGRTQKDWKRWLFWVAAIFFVFGNIVSASRGGFVGLVAVGTVCWLSSKHRLRAIPVLMMLAILAWNFASPIAKEKILGLGMNSGEKDTGKDRVELWKVGWKTFVDNPVLGVGQGNMPAVMNKYRYDQWGESFWKKDMWGRMTHSVYFTLLPELGLIGSLIFFFMLKNLVMAYRRTKMLCKTAHAHRDTLRLHDINTALLVSLVGFLITGIFLSVLYYPPLWNLAALIIAVNMIAAKTCAAMIPVQPKSQAEAAYAE